MTIRPKGFEEFVSYLINGGCEFANAKTGRRRIGITDWFLNLFGLRSFQWSDFGAWEDYNEYGSTNRDGRQIIFRESFGVRQYAVRLVRNPKKLTLGHLGSYDVVNTAGEHTTEPLNMKCLLTAWDRLARIERRIPGIECNVVNTIDVGPGGFYVPMRIAMDAGTKNRLLSETAELKLEPFPLPV